MSTQQPEALAQECADYATSLRSGANVANLKGRAPSVSFLRAADLFERAASRITELESQLAQRFDAADMATAAAQGFRDGVASAASWISVDERLPEPGNPVLLDIGKKYPIRALWAAKNTVRVGTDVDDWGEYDEETDEYYCPEGWYEWNEHEEVHWAVSETPRAWRELPQPLPAAHGPADGESNV